jgi:hypothetical protein
VQGRINGDYNPLKIPSLRRPSELCSLVIVKYARIADSSAFELVIIDLLLKYNQRLFAPVLLP